MNRHSKILITGANGFIGTHLTKRLEKEGHQVYPFPRFMFSANEQSMRDFFKGVSIDYIYHFASYGNMAQQKDEQEIFQNIVRTWNLLQATKNIPYKAFINIGTSSEYGKKDEPMTEDMCPATDTFYGATKVSATYLSRAFAIQHCKPIVTVRPFSVYGPGEADFRFIPQIIKHLQEGKTMNVDTQANHDWIYIDDFIDGVMCVTDNAHKLFGQVVNIGTGMQSSNQEIITRLEAISGKKLEVNIFDNMRENDSKIWVNGSRKLYAYDWYPKTSLTKGLKKTYEYYTK